MRHTSASIAAVVGFAVLVSTGGAFGQDWPQWRGSNRDGKASGFTAPEKWPSALKQAWKLTVGSGDSTPALVGDKLYVFARQGSEEVTLCLSAADGKEIWKSKYEAQAVSGPAAREHPGPRSSPAVAEGKVVTLGVAGVVSCLDAATGKEIWRKDEFPKVVPAFFTSASPIIVDGLCVAHVGGKDKGAVVAFDLASGNVKWKWTGEGPAYASPVVMSVEGVKQIVTIGEKSLVGLAAADGKLLWQVPAQPQGRAYNSASPIVSGSMVIYTGQAAGTKAVKIEKQGDGFTAKEAWSNAEIGTGYNTPVLKDNLLFGFSDKRCLFCLDAQTGKEAWVGSPVGGGRGNFGSVVDGGMVLVALPETPELIVYKPSNKQYEELARIKVSDTSTYAHPVLSGKRIFIKDRESLALYTVE